MNGIFIKSIIASFSSTLLVACHQLQNHQQAIIVPPSVEAAFQAKYADVPRTWQKTHYGYEANFIQNNIKYEAEFSETGKWLETEYYVQGKDFPAVVLKRIKQERPQFKITKYEIEITPQGNFYEVDITDGEIEEELYFDSSGNPQLDLYED
ncbi:PepSY-like domain-containing protein [Calothrix membranacea FACHB-236]|nr:PepSY-like domain-containing protein [Calothrix membranacea FACHB-236]